MLEWGGPIGVVVVLVGDGDGVVCKAQVGRGGVCRTALAACVAEAGWCVSKEAVFLLRVWPSGEPLCHTNPFNSVPPCPSPLHQPTPPQDAAEGACEWDVPCVSFLPGLSLQRPAHGLCLPCHVCGACGWGGGGERLCVGGGVGALLAGVWGGGTFREGGCMHACSGSQPWGKRGGGL